MKDFSLDVGKQSILLCQHYDRSLGHCLIVSNPPGKGGWQSYATIPLTEEKIREIISLLENYLATLHQNKEI
jgi:hypothetical protein